MTQAYPLQWPTHVARNRGQYAWGAFQVTPDKAVRDLCAEVERSGGTMLVISTNRPVRRDGMPMQSAREPDDPGVAVYFIRKGQNVCIPCDTFDKVWKNIRAIGLSIKDMRGPESRGCAAITDQAFTGFMALSPPSSDKPWNEVLGVSPSASVDAIQSAWKVLAKRYAGDEAMTLAINVARDEGMKGLT